jgi:hypothetical protein
LPSLVGDSIPVYSFVQYEQNARNNWAKNLEKQPWLESSAYPKISKVPSGDGYMVLQTVSEMKLLCSVSGRTFQFTNFFTPDTPYSCYFEKLDGDSYVVRDFENLRIVYNERSVNIYFSEINSLIKIRNAVFEDISKELLKLPE